MLKSLTQFFLATALVFGTTFLASAQDAGSERRIVSVGGDVTEIVYALGHGDEIVATDTTSVFPPEALETPKVGYSRQLAAESVLSLSPTLLILGGAAGPESVVEQLRAVGVDMIEMSAEYTIDNTIRKVALISEALGEPDTGAELIAQIEADWENAQSEIAQIQGTPRVLFFAAMGDGGPTAAGTGTAAHGVMEALGTENVFAGQEGYRALSVEAAVAANPDVIFVMSHNLDSLGGLEAVANHPVLVLTDAGRNGHIIAIDSVRIMSFGPRVAAGIAEAARELRAITGEAQIQ